jgi:hypothetical protein
MISRRTCSKEAWMLAGRLVLFVATVLMPLAALGANLTPENAAQHVGQTGTVCGVVASAHYAAHSRGQPTFLNLDRPYPHPVFTALVWGEDRAKFGQPEQLEGRRVCVTGMIKRYRGGDHPARSAAASTTMTGQLVRLRIRRGIEAMQAPPSKVRY